MAWFDLAASLGMSVARAQREISAREFAEWCAYRRLRDDPQDVRFARLCVWLARLQGVQTCKLEDFLPRHRPRVQTSAEMKARLQAFGASITRKRAVAARRLRRERQRIGQSQT